MSEDRRHAQRQDALVVVQLGGSQAHGVTRNASEKGLLLATRRRMTPGDKIEVTIHHKAGFVNARARVVRVDETPPEETWRFHVALELDTPLPASVIEDGTAAATRLLGPASSPGDV